jgi:hypothetical protein
LLNEVDISLFVPAARNVPFKSLEEALAMVEAEAVAPFLDVVDNLTGNADYYEADGQPELASAVRALEKYLEDDKPR